MSQKFALPPSYPNMLTFSPLRSTVVTRFLATMSLSDSRLEPLPRLCFPLLAMAKTDKRGSRLRGLRSLQKRNWKWSWQIDCRLIRWPGIGFGLLARLWGNELQRGAGAPVQLRPPKVNCMLRDRIGQGIRKEVERNLEDLLARIPAPTSFPLILVDCRSCGTIHDVETCGTGA